MIAAVQELYRREPLLTSRICGYWSNALSSAIALCLLICRAPFTCLSPAALQELERARMLFRAAKDTCARAFQALPLLEGMINKANDIYNRWYTGEELPTMILRHTNDDGSSPQHYSGYVQPRSEEAPDPFRGSHSSLMQCIVEVHERARVLFPLRKPCQCSANVPKECPPSHFWAPPPQVSPQQEPVLPPEAPSVRTDVMHVPPSAYGSQVSYHRPYDSNHELPVNGQSRPLAGLYSNRVLPVDGPALPPPSMHSTLSPDSKMAVVGSLNFEFGAFNAEQAQIGRAHV